MNCQDYELSRLPKAPGAITTIEANRPACAIAWIAIEGSTPAERNVQGVVWFAQLLTIYKDGRGRDRAISVVKKQQK